MVHLHTLTYIREKILKKEIKKTKTQSNKDCVHSDTTQMGQRQDASPFLVQDKYLCHYIRFTSRGKGWELAFCSEQKPGGQDKSYKYRQHKFKPFTCFFFFFLDNILCLSLS